MNDSANILYGGFEGTDNEICENKRSMGEFILNKFQEAENKVLLVRMLRIHNLMKKIIK